MEYYSTLKKNEIMLFVGKCDTGFKFVRFLLRVSGEMRSLDNE
jgi:hypothetical protein